MILECSKFVKQCEEENKLNVKSKMLRPVHIISIADDRASLVYARNKIKACKKIDIPCRHHILDPSDFDQEALCEYIDNIQFREECGGVIVQLPLPKEYDTDYVLNHIKYGYDIDGIGTSVTTDIYSRRSERVYNLYPCTPLGIMKYLDYLKVPIEGSNCVIIGRSSIVGKPLAMMMSNRNATVTLCHSNTKDLSLYTKNADILIVAVGKEKLITADMVKPGSIVIDVGINRNKEGKLCGDCDTEAISKLADITPVPGGVGLMTVQMFIHNIILLAPIDLSKQGPKECYKPWLDYEN